MSATALELAVEDFCNRSEVAPATRRYYRDSLVSRFVPWAIEEGLCEPGQLVPDAVDRYAAELQVRRKRDGQPLSLDTRRAYLRALRQFLSWLSKRRGVSGLDSRAVPMPASRRKVREVLTPTQMQALEDAAPIERNKLIIRIMAETAAREGEVAALTTSDLIERDRRYHFLRLRGKTGERLAPITPALYRRLVDYAEGKSGRPMKTGHAALFMAHRRRNGGGYEPLSEKGIYMVIRDAAEESGLKVYPHLLRHSRITHMVAAGMNIVTVAEIVGNSVEVIARHYSHQSDQQRHEAWMRAMGVG